MPLKAMAPRVPLQIHAFQEEAKHEQHDEKHDEKQVQKHQPGQGSSMMRADPYSRFGRLPSIFSEMQREMDALTRSFGLFDDSDFLMAPFRSSPLLADMQRHFDMPAMEAKMPLLRLATDIEEDEGAFTIKADIPGMSKEDVKIKVIDGTLTISGERKEEKKEGETAEGKAARIERSYGSFVRSFSLPANVDAAGIKATAKDGVLTVVVPKVEVQEPQAQEIAIE